MQKLTGEVQGPLLVDGEMEIEGTLTGGATVTGILDLRGVCDGNLLVENGGEADVEAVVHGDIRVSDGRLRLRGIVEGRMALNKGADVGLAVGTVIGGRQLQEDGTFVPMEGPQEIRFNDDTLVLRMTPEGTWIPAREIALLHPDRTVAMPRIDVPDGGASRRVRPAHVDLPQAKVAEGESPRGRHRSPDDE